MLVAVAALYSLRPSKTVKLAQKVDAQKDDFLDKYGKELSTGKEEKTDAPEKPTKPKQMITSTAQVNVSYAEHGTGALLRLHEKLKYRKGKLPIIENPDYDNPLQLSFYSLKKIYAIYRLQHGRFPDVAVQKLNGAAVEISGAIMPVDPVPESGTLMRFWLANPVVVMAGCVFCNPPTLADLILVKTPFGTRPLTVNREQLFKNIVMVRMKGRLMFGPDVDGKVEYMFRMNFVSAAPIN